MLVLGLSGTAAPGLERLLVRRVGGSASVRDFEAEGLANEPAPNIKDYSALVAKLEQLSGNHATCSITEFANWIKVSRQDVVV